MTTTSAICFWVALGCLMCAWTTFALPGYPGRDELTKGAVGIVYGLCLLLGPLLVIYMSIVSIADLIELLKKEKE